MFESGVRNALNSGLADETVKVTFSTQLKSAVDTGVEAMKAAHLATSQV